MSKDDLPTLILEIDDLRAQLAALPGASRPGVVAELAKQLSASRAAAHWTGVLAGTTDTVTRHLALAVTAWLPVPLDPSLVPLLRPLLSEKLIPGNVRLDAATVLLQTTGVEGPDAEVILQTLLARTGKARAVDRLRLLMQRLGKSPLLEQLCTHLEAQIRMRCPRCRAQLRRPDMAQHLWAEHGLVLEGRKAREPWHLVADWIAAYERWGNAELLQRCRDLAQRLEGEPGLCRLQRLLLTKGIEEGPVRQALEEQAARDRASLCPSCYALVPMPGHVEPQPFIESHGRLSCAGYTADVSERGLSPLLELTTPAGPVFRGREPGHRLTRRGATVLLAGPPVLLALAAGLVLSLLEIGSLWPVMLPLTAALLIACGIQLHWLNAPTAVERAVDHAWTRLVPQLHAGSSEPAAASFLTGLAQTSLRHGTRATRAGELKRLLREAEQAVRTGQTRLGHLASLHRLAIADAATAGEDGVKLLTAQVRRCFVGELPLAFAHDLLRLDEALPRSSADQARLRVLLCDAAFEAGLEVRDLLAAGRAAPALGAVLEMEQQERMAHLRLLWSLRPRQPWRRWGNARTVFELAVEPHVAAEPFARHPDLLLADLELPWIFVTSRGVSFREALFTEMPAPLCVRETLAGGEITYELVAGSERFTFWHNPTPLRARLEGWLQFHAGEIQAGLAEVYNWHAPSPPPTLVAEEVTSCPECRTWFWARLGQVGQAVQRGAATTAQSAAPPR